MRELLEASLGTATEFEIVSRRELLLQIAQTLGFSIPTTKVVTSEEEIHRWFCSRQNRSRSEYGRDLWRRVKRDRPISGAGEECFTRVLATDRFPCRLQASLDQPLSSVVMNPGASWRKRRSASSN